ncbi:MAG: type II toxin-antitoxin system VapC family toxin [Candidatus Micrarchaeaceae archaeon]
MSEVVFDTSILIDHLRGVSHASELIEKVSEGTTIGHISVITISELFAGRDAGNERKRRLLEELVNLFNHVEISEAIAKSAGDIRRKYNSNLIDSLIAATALNLNCKLLTKDFNNFRVIKEINIEDPY